MSSRLPRVMYWVEDKNLKRVFMPFKEDDRLVQAIVMPQQLSSEGLQINTKFRYTVARQQIKTFLKKFKPDVFVQCSAGSSIRHYIKSYEIKHAFISHGIWAKSETNLARVSGIFWREFDLLCGANNQWKEIFVECSDTKALVVSNAMPQLDILYDHMQHDQEKLRDDILRFSTNPGADKIITLFGHNCKDTKTARALNEGFYRVAVDLGRLAEKHNWLVIIKPKKSAVNKYITNAIGKHKWVRELIKPYRDLHNNKYVKFVSPDSDPYIYFCSDVIVATHGSTIEIEAILADKPLVRVYITDREPDMIYEFGILDNGAAHVVRDIDDLEDTMLRALDDRSDEMKHNIDEFIELMGITFDGRAHERVVDAIIKVCSGDK